METILPALTSAAARPQPHVVPSLDDVILFNSSDLPVLGTSAIDQILVDTPSPSSYASSSSDMDRMSPDSSMDWANNGGHAHQQMIPSPVHSTASSSNVPDSTTADHNNSSSNANTTGYDSNEFDSDDSTQSLEWGNTLPTVQAPSAPPAAAIPVAPAAEEQPTKKRKKKKTKRAGDVVLRCHLCHYTTRYKEHLTSHMHTHCPDRAHMCSDCGQTFKWSHSLRRHQRTHRPDDDRFRLACRFCLKTFSRRDHLNIHENLHSASGQSHPCPDCGATFKNKKTLAGHMKTHSTEKAFRCGQCKSEFTRRASLNRHVRAAHAREVIQCPHCPSRFSYRSTLEDHKKAAHNHGRKEFACDLCGIQFAVKAYLTKHMVRETVISRAIGAAKSQESGRIPFRPLFSRSRTTLRFWGMDGGSEEFSAEKVAMTSLENCGRNWAKTLGEGVLWRLFLPSSLARTAAGTPTPASASVHLKVT